MFTLALGLSVLATAQSSGTSDQFWPELNVLVGGNSGLRALFVQSFNQLDKTLNWKGQFQTNIEFAIKPVFRRELKDRADLFKTRYVTVLIGYWQIPTFGTTDEENRLVLQTLPRLPLPGKLILNDRNRVELRWIKGQGFSARYRNRMQLEREFSIGRFVFTPNIFGELFYDTRYDLWNRNQYGMGVHIPIGRRFAMEPSVLHLNQSHESPPHVNAFGLGFYIYF